VEEPREFGRERGVASVDQLIQLGTVPLEADVQRCAKSPHYAIQGMQCDAFDFTALDPGN